MKIESIIAKFVDCEKLTEKEIEFLKAEGSRGQHYLKRYNNRLRVEYLESVISEIASILVREKVNREEFELIKRGIEGGILDTPLVFERMDEASRSPKSAGVKYV